MLSHFCGPHHRNCSTMSAFPHFSLLVCRSLLWVVEILQVEVQSLLRVEPLVGDWRLELPVHLDADILDRTIARLRSIADFHRLGHCLRRAQRHPGKMWLQLSWLLQPKNG